MTYPPPNVPPGSAPRVPRPTLNPVDLGIVGAAVVAFVFSFLKHYYTADLKDLGSICRAVGPANGLDASQCSNPSVLAQIKAGIGSHTSESIGAWSQGFFGWFGPLLLLVAALVVVVRIVAPTLAVPFGPITLGFAALGLISVVVSLFVIPKGDNGGIPDSEIDKIANFGHGYSFWVVFILALVVVALAALRLRSAAPTTASGAQPGFYGQSPQGQPPYGQSQGQPPYGQQPPHPPQS